MWEEKGFYSVASKDTGSSFSKFTAHTPSIVTKHNPTLQYVRLSFEEVFSDASGASDDNSKVHSALSSAELSSQSCRAELEWTCHSLT
jgi:hypothetical protein